MDSRALLFSFCFLFFFSLLHNVQANADDISIGCLNVDVKCKAAYVIEFAYVDCDHPTQPAITVDVPVGQTKSIRVIPGAKIDFHMKFFGSIVVHQFFKDTKVECTGTLFNPSCTFS